MTTATYPVSGMTCGHCVAVAADELAAVPGVTEVTVELNTGAAATVTVTSDNPLTTAQVEAALDKAGDYHLTSIS